jgi:glutamate racemase
MRRAAIGIFDSGIGGLTVAAEIVKHLPCEDVVYLGDTARLPYGTKSASTVCRYAERATELLLRYPIKAVLVACNTASAHALPTLRAMTDMPILGVVDPGARAAVAATRSGVVGIAGTEATIRSGAYQSALKALRGDLTLTAAAWPLLVPLAEEGWTDHAAARLIVTTYLEPFVAAGVDTLVLGCTHYPVFKAVIAEVLKSEFGLSDVALVDSAEAVTLELTELLKAQSLEAPERVGRRSFFCTDAPARFVRVGAGFFPAGDLTAVSAVDL